MPNPPKPLVPNISTGAFTGRVATDVYDFRNHTDGYAFRHKASQIDLFPTVVIGSEVTNVQDAIVALKDALTIPVLPDATASVKGALKLTNDLGGTADLPSVVAIRGFPVSATPPTLNYVLTWQGSSWGPASVGASFTLSGDVTGSVAANTVGKLQGRPVSSSSPTTNDGLVWNGSQWAPSRTVPSGTGFATVTSGSFDNNATANIRYTGGKFQTDTSIQWKNTSITGDLVWLPTSSNKTITLPDATDTLIGRNTSDILTNKNINATNNTITDTGIAAGDVLVSNGSKFVRLAKGSNGSFLGVSAGTVGYYTPASSTPSGTGFATITGGVYDPTATTEFNTDTYELTADFMEAGDLLMCNGDKFVRFGIGDPGQVLMMDGGDVIWGDFSGAASEGTDTLQRSDGDGGFLSCDIMEAGDDYIGWTDSIMTGSLPSNGALRFGRLLNGDGATTYSIITAKDSGDADRGIFRYSSNGSVTVGDTNFSAYLSGETAGVLSGGNGMYMNKNGSGTYANFFGTVTGISTAINYISMANSGVVPTGTPTGGGYMFVEGGALKFKGGGGTLTTIGPADPHCKKCGRDFMHEWVNDSYGKLATCMPCLLDALETLGINVDAFSDRELNS